jgi:hypothetical protein
MKKLAAVRGVVVAAVVAAVTMVAAIALVVTLSSPSAAKPAPTAGSSWANLPSISLGSLLQL